MEKIAYTTIPNDLLKLKMRLRETAKKTSHSRSPRVDRVPQASPIRQSPRRQKRPSSAKIMRRFPRQHNLYSNNTNSRPQTAKVRLRTSSASVTRDRYTQSEKKSSSFGRAEETELIGFPAASANSPRKLVNELSIQASMLTNSRKVQTGLRSNRTHEKLNKTKGHENARRIKSISPKIKFLMQQYLNWENTGVASSSSSTHFKNTLVDEAFTVQWIAEQTGLNSHEVDKLIEREVESSVLMGHMKSKLTSKVACCLCLNGLEKLETELPQYAKFLKTARRVFASSIFEDEEADSNANGRNVKNQS